MGQRHKQDGLGEMRLRGRWLPGCIGSMESPANQLNPPRERPMRLDRFQDVVFWVLAAFFFAQIWLMLWPDMRG